MRVGGCDGSVHAGGKHRGECLNGACVDIV